MKGVQTLPDSQTKKQYYIKSNIKVIKLINIKPR
jgi:hypothetical protein